MNFEQFKEKYQKGEVKEFPNKRGNKVPLVTVKVVTYNHVNYIAECLDSILLQETNFDFEIFIAEDESNDGTREICINYAQRYPEKIRLLLNSRKNNIPTEGKPSGLFNSIYANYMINSKYISICEGDDYWCDKKSLSKKISFLEKNKDFVLAFSNFNRLYSNTGEIHVRPAIKFKKNTIIKKEDILKSNIQTVSNVFRNNLIDKYDSDMSGILVGDLILRGKLSHYGKGYYIHDIEPEVYRIHNEGNYSALTRRHQVEQTVKGLEYLVEYYQEKKQDNNHIIQYLVHCCLHSFLRSLLINQTVQFELVKKAKTYAKQYNLSLLMQSLNAFRELIHNFIYLKCSAIQTKSQSFHNGNT